MMDIRRKIAALFGARYVVLTDYDGEETVVRRRAGSNAVMRFQYAPDSRCVLKEDGTIHMPRQDANYVRTWKPYRP